MSILVVDDAGIMRMILRDILMRYGNISKEDIIEAVDGADAVQKYKYHTPELVLCDIAMPDMNGIEVVKVLKELKPDVKIIMCTASTDQSDVRDCIRAGAIDYIIKPPKPERVIQAIESATGRKITNAEDEPVAKTPAQANAAPQAPAAGISSGDVVSRKEFDEFFNEFLALRERVDKLAAKIK